MRVLARTFGVSRPRRGRRGVGVTRPPAPALTAEEARTAAAGERQEAVARALWEASHDRTAWEDATEDGPDVYRRLAAAAIAALPPSPAELAVKRVEVIRAVREDAWREGYEACRRGEQKHNPYRAALASPAPAPHGPEPCPACGSRTSIHDGNAHATASMTVPAPQGEERACAMCGATDHREWAH